MPHPTHHLTDLLALWALLLGQNGGGGGVLLTTNSNLPQQLDGSTQMLGL